MLAAVTLEERVESFGFSDDLDVMIELSRLRIDMQILSADGPAPFHLILAERLAIRFDLTQQDEDLSEAEDLISAATKLETHARYDVYRNLVKGRIFHIRYEKFRQHKHILASMQAYSEALFGLDQNCARPQPVMFSTCISLAWLLREAYHKQPPFMFGIQRESVNW